MATIDSTPIRRRKLNDLTPARVYEENVAALYLISRYFFSESVTTEILNAVATELTTAVTGAGYQRYSKLLCINIFYQILKKDPRATAPKSIFPEGLATGVSLTVAQTFSLILRDRFELSCSEIAAIIGTSDGSVRTRLEKIRSSLFRGNSSQDIRTTNTTNPNHICIRTREQIEDWNVSNMRLGQFTIPSLLTKNIGSCGRCERIIQQRLASISLCKELPDYVLPEQLKQFPLSPLVIKDGKKVILNWSSAPWYAKAIFEGLLATTLVLGVILSIPRIKNVYEFWLEKRFDFYSIAELAASLGSHTDVQSEIAKPKDSQPEAQKSSNKPSKAADTAQGSIKPETEFLGRENSVASSEKLYRILIKTDAPESTKDLVLKLLNEAHFSPGDSDSQMGAELPGGVMFDAFIPLKGYKELEKSLTRLGETKVIITKSKERGVPGKARVKIWLQRI